MWTNSIAKSDVENDSYVVYVTFTSDVDGAMVSKIMPFPLNTDPTQVQAQILSIQNGLNNIVALKAALPTGPVTPPLPPPPPVIEPPTDAQVQQAAYNQALGVRNQVLQAIAVGAVKVGDPDDVNSIAAVVSAYALVQPSIQTAINAANSTVTAAPVPVQLKQVTP